MWMNQLTTTFDLISVWADVWKKRKAFDGPGGQLNLLLVSSRHGHVHVARPFCKRNRSGRGRSSDSSTRGNFPLLEKKKNSNEIERTGNGADWTVCVILAAAEKKIDKKSQRERERERARMLRTAVSPLWPKIHRWSITFHSGAAFLRRTPRENFRPFATSSAPVNRFVIIGHFGSCHFGSSKSSAQVGEGREVCSFTFLIRCRQL